MPTSERTIPVREKLLSERPGFVRRFHLVYFEDEVKKELTFYIQPGMYEDGRLGEIFITGSYQNDLIRGALDSMAMMLSLGLQHGVPLQTMTAKLRHNAFGPAGLTGDPEFRRCTSVFDLIAQYLDAKFPGGRYVAGQPETVAEPAAAAEQPPAAEPELAKTGT